MKPSVVLGLVTAHTAVAQQSAWGQCGGQGWTGPTTCVSGYYCAYQNPYYSQCIPGTASTTLTTSTTQATSTTTIRTTSTSSAPATTTTASAGTFAKVSGTKFNIDGNVGYFAGTNSYWIGFLTNNADIDLVMGHLQQSGLKILRVWGFNDVTTDNPGTVYFQKFTGSSPTINTGTDGLQRLDYVVQSAAKYGIKLIINFVNNWTDYGGMDAYVSYYGLANHQAWYTSSAAQAQYQKYIAAVVSRYKTSTAVFAWELANEPRCAGCATSVIYNWAKTTSEYIKSLDSNHMVTLGDEGFNPSAGDGSYPYQTGEGIAFAENLKISTLDFGTYHMYPTSWGQSESTFPLPWIQAHGAACTTANKPCMFEEYGSTTNHAQYATWQNASLNTAGNAADLFWQLGDTLSTGQTHNDGNTVYYGGSEWNVVVTQHVAAVKAKNGF